MKFETGQLVEFDRLRPRLRLHPPLRLRLRWKLHELKDEGATVLGTIVECHKAEDAYKDYQDSDPNCYIVFWHRLGVCCLMFENELKKAPDTKEKKQ